MDKKTNLKLSFNNDNLSNDLIIKLREFISSLDEFDVSELIICEKPNQLGFGIFADNGFGNQMKRFTIILEDFK